MHSYPGIDMGFPKLVLWGEDKGYDNDDLLETIEHNGAEANNDNVRLLFRRLWLDHRSYRPFFGLEFLRYVIPLLLFSLPS